MRGTGGIYKLGNYMNFICNVQSSYSEILESAYHASVLSRICK